MRHGHRPPPEPLRPHGDVLKARLPRLLPGLEFAPALDAQRQQQQRPGRHLRLDPPRRRSRPRRQKARLPLLPRRGPHFHPRLESQNHLRPRQGQRRMETPLQGRRHRPRRGLRLLPDLRSQGRRPRRLHVVLLGTQRRPRRPRHHRRRTLRQARMERSPTRRGRRRRRGSPPHHPRRRPQEKNQSPRRRRLPHLLPRKNSRRRLRRKAPHRRTHENAHRRRLALVEPSSSKSIIWRPTNERTNGRKKKQLSTLDRTYDDAERLATANKQNKQRHRETR
mmetsp:Transcript_32872/g.104871  ORF Transcript_32872/g.104871 Transcript_32872/m.104871 type:complete len:279 (+) Transcript_32872:1254-2090(+)